MAKTEIIADADRIDAPWLTRMLRTAGALRAGVRVSGVDAHPVGNGMLGDSVRFTLRYDGDADGAPRA